MLVLHLCTAVERDVGVHADPPLAPDSLPSLSTVEVWIRSVMKSLLYLHRRCDRTCGCRHVATAQGVRTAAV